jgi:hypothetical protein
MLSRLPVFQSRNFSDGAIPGEGMPARSVGEWDVVDHLKAEFPDAWPETNPSGEAGTEERQEGRGKGRHRRRVKFRRNPGPFSPRSTR